MVRWVVEEGNFCIHCWYWGRHSTWGGVKWKTADAAASEPSIWCFANSALDTRDERYDSSGHSKTETNSDVNTD